MFEHKISIYHMLNLARQAYQRHTLIAQHLSEHFNIHYDVFTPDPLFDATVDLLSEHIRDHCLLMWWLRHDDNDCFYANPHSLGCCEIYTPQQLVEYYNTTQKKEEK